MIDQDREPDSSRRSHLTTSGVLRGLVTCRGSFLGGKFAGTNLFLGLNVDGVAVLVRHDSLLISRVRERCGSKGSATRMFDLIVLALSHARPSHAKLELRRLGTYVVGHFVQGLALVLEEVHVGDGVLENDGLAATVTGHSGDDVSDAVEACADGISTLLLGLDVVLLLLLVGEA